MEFDLNKTLDLLRRTPNALISLLQDFDPGWSNLNEGDDTWSAFDIVEHLIHGEKTDWIPRAQIILNYGISRPFEPFDRFAMKKDSEGKLLNDLLLEFSELRRHNLETLQSWNLQSSDLKKQGKHPELGVVTLAQLLASWSVHDLNHLGQISRVLANQYKDQAGPWVKYLGILHR